jgi:hypothetical protein
LAKTKARRISKGGNFRVQLVKGNSWEPTDLILKNKSFREQSFFVFRGIFQKPPKCKLSTLLFWQIANNKFNDCEPGIFYFEWQKNRLCLVKHRVLIVEEKKYRYLAI